MLLKDFFCVSLQSSVDIEFKLNAFFVLDQMGLTKLMCLMNVT